MAWKFGFLSLSLNKFPAHALLALSRPLAVCSVLAHGAAYADTPTPRYQEQSEAAGLSHIYGGDSAFVVGGGAASFDCSGDGLPDLALAGGDNPLSILRTLPGPAVRFERVDNEQITRATGIYPLDYDNDGVMDLFVLRFAQNIMLRGLGGCLFENTTNDIGLPDRTDWTTAFAATWEAGNTLPTLFIGNYVPRDRPLQATGNCETSYILSPMGARYGAPKDMPGACTLSALFVDWNGTGERALRLANDRAYYDRGQGEEMWRLASYGPEPFSADDGWAKTVIWGMGLAAHDIDGDTRPEIAVTNMADNYLQALSAADTPTYTNQALRWNTMAQRPYAGGDTRPSTAWHVAFEDFNNDARRDLWIVKGNVDAMPEHAAFDPDSLLLRDGERFEESGEAAGIAVNSRGRGGAVADFNGDGALDMVTVNREEPARLFIAKAPLGNWLAVDPQQMAPNAHAVDARVEVFANGQITAATRSIGGGHAGGGHLPLHFGLGEASVADVRIIWPDGTASAWQPLRAGQTHIIRKGATK